MTTQTIFKAIKTKKPAVISEHGSPRYVILDWKTYRKWEATKEDYEDAVRLLEALADPKNQKRIDYSELN